MIFIEVIVIFHGWNLNVSNSLFFCVFNQAVLGKYQWETFNDVNEHVRNLASGLLSLNEGSTNKNVCIFAETRAEWIISVFACFKINFPGI